MEKVAVASSNVACVGYDEDTHTLEVEFNNGSVYQYSDVPIHVFDELVNAGSVGSYLHHNIKNIYGCTRV